MDNLGLDVDVTKDGESQNGDSGYSNGGSTATLGSVPNGQRESNPSNSNGNGNGVSGTPRCTLPQGHDLSSGHSHSHMSHHHDEPTEELLYGIEDVPPWYMCVFLGFQHYLEMIGATMACPFFLTPVLCMLEDDANKANIISTLVFMSGVITILQSTFGARLPIVQGGSFSYLIPSLAIMGLPQWKCPPQETIHAMSEEDRTELWQVRIREIQGAIIFAALFETLFALTGVIGYLLKFLTPMTIAPAISLIGISLFRQTAVEVSKNVPVALGTLALLILFSQHLRIVKIPLLSGADGKREKFPIFQVFPVLLSLATMWAICGILTVTNVLPEGDPGRTDAKIKILQGSPWFRVPYPFQWGWPTVTLGAVLGMFCGTITTTIESLGDYYACAQIAQTTTPPIHAMNRGIFFEGLGCILSGIWGSGNASTSYSNNIGTLAVTKVASRRVIQVAGVIMILLALVAKAGAVFIGLPDPIIGGLFCFIFPLIMTVGLGTLAEVSLLSARNLFVISFSLFWGLAVSEWMTAHPGAIKTGNPDLDNLIEILLSTGMFIAGMTGFILDNTVSGTLEERGLTQRKKAELAAVLAGDTAYDMPFGMGVLRRIKWLKYFPISPTYEGNALAFLPFCRQNSKKNKDIVEEYRL